MVEIEIKVLFLGESGVGITNLINRITGKEFDQNPYSTKSGCYISKNIEFEGKKYEFDLWEIASQQALRNLAKLFYKYSKIVVFVYDITNKTSFLELDYWIDSIIKELGQNLYFILIANKSDLFDNEQVREIREEDGEKFAEIIRAKFMEVSAKDNNWVHKFDDFFFLIVFELFL